MCTYVIETEEEHCQARFNRFLLVLEYNQKSHLRKTNLEIKIQLAL